MPSINWLKDVYVLLLTEELLTGSKYFTIEKIKQVNNLIIIVF